MIYLLPKCPNNTIYAFSHCSKNSQNFTRNIFSLLEEISSNFYNSRVFLLFKLVEIFVPLFVVHSTHLHTIDTLEQRLGKWFNNLFVADLISFDISSKMLHSRICCWSWEWKHNRRSECQTNIPQQGSHGTDLEPRTHSQAETNKLAEKIFASILKDFHDTKSEYFLSILSVVWQCQWQARWNTWD